MGRNPFVSRKATEEYARVDNATGHRGTLEYYSGDPAPKPKLEVPDRRTAEQMWRDEMLAELRQLTQTSTDAWARANGSQIVNSVLEVWANVMPTDGYVVRDFHVAVGSIVVINAGTAAMTYQVGSSPGATAPTSGKGVQPIPAGSWLSIPVGAHAFTLWGTVGQPYGVQVFAGMQAFGVAR